MVLIRKWKEIRWFLIILLIAIFAFGGIVYWRGWSNDRILAILGVLSFVASAVLSYFSLSISNKIHKDNLEFEKRIALRKERMEFLENAVDYLNFWNSDPHKEPYSFWNYSVIEGQKVLKSRENVDKFLNYYNTQKVVIYRVQGASYEELLERLGKKFYKVYLFEPELRLEAYENIKTEREAEFTQKVSFIADTLALNIEDWLKEFEEYVKMENLLLNKIDFMKRIMEEIKQGKDIDTIDYHLRELKNLGDENCHTLHMKFKKLRGSLIKSIKEQSKLE